MGAGSSTRAVAIIEPPAWREKGTPEEERRRKEEFERRRNEHYAGVAPAAGMGRKSHQYRKQPSQGKPAPSREDSARKDFSKLSLT
mmetsp:Transcript_562/g.1267  ORF Transcript_562/g.1267 Transcript_562/m.1267 type:complete len:86 (+) Transcript_562:209-466(+)